MKLKSIKLTVLFIAGLIGISSIAIPPTYAYDVCSSNASDEVKEASGCPDYGTADKLPSLIQNILSAIIGVAGLVSVVFVIIGGINYMTSSGDASKIEKAKKTILYALIGLIICVLSFAIVNFVIKKIIK